MNWRNLDRLTPTGRRLHNLDKRVTRLELQRREFEARLERRDGFPESPSTTRTAAP